MSSICTLDPLIGALVAGGDSRRMGSPKATLRLGGRALAQWPAAAIAAVCRRCIQVGGTALAQPGWKCVPDRRSGAGPGGGIETALLFAPGAAVVLSPVDMPFVTPELLARACALVAAGSVAAAPRHEGRWHPLSGACSPALLPRLSEWLDSGRRDLQGLYDEVGASPIEGADLETLGDLDQLLLNVNEPADLERARRLL